ncbi:MAG: cytidylate kinase-like family protein [Proteobacteria bacterium]|nr:cytidylate kinase-like family protein [Pseudomonadota bacterium]
MAIITISRPYGSGGTLFAQELAKKTNYTYIDKNYCAIVGEEVKHCLTYFEHEDETAPVLLDRISELMNNRSFYKVNLLATIYSLALKNNVIFVGRGANIILQGVPNVLSLQIVGNIEDRVKAIAELKNLSYDDALKLIQKMDNEKRKFIEYYFDKNIFDPTLYHFVINLSYVPLNNAVDTIIDYVNKYFGEEDFKKSESILKNRLIEKKAEVIVFGLDLTQNTKANFTMRDDGTLIVKGMVSSENEKNRLIKALENIEEVKKIEDNLKIGILSRMIY